MSYPVLTFANFTELLNYINNEWITNGEQDITGVIGNNVVNGLLTFIEQSPLNYQKAAIISTGGVVVTSQPITVIIGTVPTSLNWTDNIYNQNIFINSTTSAIPLANGVVYYNSALVVQNNIPPQSTISIAKAKNGQWIQINQNGGGFVGVKPPIAGSVGDEGLPEADLNFYTDARLINLGAANNNNIMFFLAGTPYYNYGNNVSFDYTPSSGTIVLRSGVFNEGDDFNINTNQ